MYRRGVCEEGEEESEYERERARMRVGLRWCMCGWRCVHTHSHWHTCMTLAHSLTWPHTHTHTHTHRLPPDYHDLIQFFSRYPGLVKWTGKPLLLYFNAGSLDVATIFTLWPTLRLPLLRLTITPHSRAPSTLTKTVMSVSFSISLTFGFWRRRTLVTPS